ncbi:hypothetical protein C6N01_13040 [Enterococcus faecalis]|uniref:hypothetical protein n=1 Tax=Enterococcus TaxID=1350 RepID=UPI0013627F07|nr:hypothetical protein [Enterococcus faecalis]EJW9248818.1 hypothetical protein [Enterococcus faecalis]NBJ47133.1 hypothetical protein [Enterococcus faecalis]
MKNKVKKNVRYIIATIQTIIGLGWIEVSTMTPVFADVKQTLDGVESGLGTEFKRFANPALGIAILIYGAARFLGHDFSQTAKKWVLGAFIGAAFIVNFMWIKDTVWGWLGG